MDNGSDVRASRPGQRQTSERKVLDKEKKGRNLAVTISSDVATTGI